MSGAGLTFLFWNLKRARADILASLVKRENVDVLILAECPLRPAEILTALNQEFSDYFYVPNRCPRIAAYTRFSEQFLAPLEPHVEGEYWAIRRLVLPGRLAILLCMVHFPSKLHRSSDDQSAFATDFARTILAQAEAREQHERTVLVGDLNMNPYENGVVQYNGLHGVMTREIARREMRTVNFQSNRFFYNPMWRHFGERPEGHAGTYYYGSPKSRADYWNIYDQVLVRPDLLPYFRDEELRIIHHDANLDLSLLRMGKPDLQEVSDHLPIVFHLHI